MRDFAGHVESHIAEHGVQSHSRAQLAHSTPFVVQVSILTRNDVDCDIQFRSEGLQIAY